MNSPGTHARLTSFAPQFLVQDLARSIVYYVGSGSRSASRGTVSMRSGRGMGSSST